MQNPVHVPKKEDVVREARTHDLHVTARCSSYHTKKKKKVSL